MTKRNSIPFIELIENLFETDKSPNGERILKKIPNNLIGISRQTVDWLLGQKELSKVIMSESAEAMFLNLNEYDKKQIVKEIKQIVYFPNGNNVRRDLKGSIARLWKTVSPFNGYHYIITFEKLGPNIHIKDIYFNNELLGTRPNISSERNVMYEVSRTKTPASFSENFDDKTVTKLQAGWNSENAKPVHRIETRHAAVNGMQNELTKASWLMGTHVDVAHANENVGKYTLFHNPSEGGKRDSLECVWDKRWANAIGIKGYSSNVQHLSAVLHETQQRGHKTDWTVHSQGAIIFARAVREHLKRRGGSLSCHTVSLHGTGCSEKDALLVCKQAGIIVNNIRNNPFDLVPNVAGANNVGLSGLQRAAKFKGLVFGDDALASPHTLPYLGIETYHAQLLLAGKKEHAGIVKNYMLKNGINC